MKIRYTSSSLLVAIILLAAACQSVSTESPSEAGAALGLWAASRMFPDGQFHTEKYMEALAAARAAADRGSGIQDGSQLVLSILAAERCAWPNIRSTPILSGWAVPRAVSGKRLQAVAAPRHGSAWKLVFRYSA